MYPKLFQIGPIPIYTYGVLLTTALLVAITVAARLGEKDGIPRSVIWDFGFVIIVSAIVGAKLLMVLTALGYYLHNPGRLVSLEFLQAGGVFYGGLLGAIVGGIWFTRRHPGLGFWQIADVAAPSIALGQSIGRLGCFSAGCDYGSPTHVPWAVTFTNKYAAQMVGTPLNVPVHPYQLYESAATLLLFFGLLWAHRKRAFTGQTFLLYLGSYAVLRFFLEFFRGDADRGFVFHGLLSTSQFISLLILPAAVVAYTYLRRREAPSVGDHHLQRS